MTCGAVLVVACSKGCLELNGCGVIMGMLCCRKCFVICWYVFLLFIVGFSWSKGVDVSCM